MPFSEVPYTLAVLTPRAIVSTPSKGIVHGGAVASALDDILGTMVWREAGFSRAGIPTMQLTVRYKGASLMGHPLRFDTRVVKREGRKVSRHIRPPCGKKSHFFMQSTSHMSEAHVVVFDAAERGVSFCVYSLTVYVLLRYLHALPYSASLDKCVMPVKFVSRTARALRVNPLVASGIQIYIQPQNLSGRRGCQVPPGPGMCTGAVWNASAVSFSRKAVHFCDYFFPDRSSLPPRNERCSPRLLYEIPRPGRY